MSKELFAPGLDPNNPGDTNRDPNNLNDDVRIMFEDLFGEPEGAHSIDCCWKCSFNCFNCSKNCCYKCLGLFCACPMAWCWGFEFAVLAFRIIWDITPTFRYYKIWLSMMRRFFMLYIDCCLGPICETCGLCFSKVAVQQG